MQRTPSRERKPFDQHAGVLEPCHATAGSKTADNCVPLSGDEECKRSVPPAQAQAMRTT